MHILGFHAGKHDSGACLFEDQTLLAFIKEERLNRIKNAGGQFELAAVDEVCSIAGIDRKKIDVVVFSHGIFPKKCNKLINHSPLSYYLNCKGFFRNFRHSLSGRDRLFRSFSLYRKNLQLQINDIVDEPVLKAAMGLRPDCRIEYIGHHFSHIAAAVKYTDWQEKALYISADGGGDGAFYSAYYLNDGKLECLLGTLESTRFVPQNSGASMGLAYARITELAGFRKNRHEGKITGLAAFGKPVAAEKIAAHFFINQEGCVDSEFKNEKALYAYLNDLYKTMSREDAAASIQGALEKVIIDWITFLRKGRDVKYIALSGGVFANVLLNQKISELPGIQGVFVVPPMGDEGLPLGNVAAYLLKKEGISGLKRELLRTVYYGREYTGAQLIEEAERQGFAIRHFHDVASATAELLAQHKIGALFSARMEMGPRALGARSILANPDKRGINDSLNRRLERTEFMPFAPYVLDCDAEQVFFISQSQRLPCRYMTITVNTRKDFADKIQAVVHVDGTARPQIIERCDNPLYYDILRKFRDLTGIPCLVNTSFNAHEEPIINKPEEALRALAHDRIDFLICDEGLMAKDVNIFKRLEQH